MVSVPVSYSLIQVPTTAPCLHDRVGSYGNGPAKVVKAGLVFLSSSVSHLLQRMVSSVMEFAIKSNSLEEGIFLARDDIH